MPFITEAEAAAAQGKRNDESSRGPPVIPLAWTLTLAAMTASVPPSRCPTHHEKAWFIKNNSPMLSSKQLMGLFRLEVEFAQSNTSIAPRYRGPANCFQ
jgi:hypothetical protein